MKIETVRLVIKFFSHYNVLIKSQCNKSDTWSASETHTCIVRCRIQSFTLFENKCIVREDIILRLWNRKKLDLGIKLQYAVRKNETTSFPWSRLTNCPPGTP